MTDAAGYGAEPGGEFEEPSWGEVDLAVFARIVVVSPHFDDAVLGAAHLLTTYADSTVITVLGGRPPAYPAEATEWDAPGGFVAGDDVVALRREEDVAAMAVWGRPPSGSSSPTTSTWPSDERPTAPTWRRLWAPPSPASIPPPSSSRWAWPTPTTT